MSRAQQTRIGALLATLVIGTWLSLHLAGLFWLPMSWLVTIPIVALQSWLSVGLFIVSHDAIHGSLLPTRPRLNIAVGALAAFLYAGFDYRDLRRQHLRHHVDPGSQMDPDFHAGNPTQFWPWYLTFLRRYFRAKEFTIMTLRVGLYILLGATVGNIMVYFALPAILASLQLFYFGTYLPHRHEENAFADAHRARSLKYRYWLSLLTCFHFGHHHEHHLSPGTPWWGLPACRSMPRVP